MTTVAQRLAAVFGSAWHTNHDAIMAQLETEIEAGGDTVPGTATANAPVVLDANKAVDVVRTASLRIGASGSEVAVDATPLELNRATDVSSRLVSLAVSTSITEAAHEGRTIVMSGAGGARTFTLPAATGGGGKYRFVVGEVNTSGYLIKSVAGADLMKGCIIGNDGGGVTTPLVWAAGATDDTITLNGTTTGGVSIGDWVELEDISATGWAVRGVVQQSGSEATPFSDTVA